ncbi:MAG: FkbM family methyltransferase [Proteobacteria bacterium]|nr:FkbM family methyltransferase [Pseudomonadota bacterium]
MNRLVTGALIAVVRPYVRRELPGWGYLYRHLIGDYRRDSLWRGQPDRWIRGKLHGHEIKLNISGWSNRATFFLERFYDLPTQLLLSAVLRPGDLFVDIGANEGMMSLLASARVGPAGRVIAFEPNPGPRGRLDEAITRNAIANIDLRACGLADSPGTLSLFVPSNNSGEGTFTDAGRDDGTTIQAPVEVGDAQLATETPRLIKIDVEGFEFRVIAGLEQLLKRARPIIVMEMIAGHLGRDSQSPEAIMERLKSLGYAARRMDLEKRRGVQALVLRPVPQPWLDGDYVFAPADRIDHILP